MEQYELFCRMIDMLKERGISFSLRHCANSAAIMELPDVQMDMVRAGITLYGLWPSSEMGSLLSAASGHVSPQPYRGDP